ncbi:PAAR domain-containing protein [Pseudomonas cichorii]|nr:PAAR domain-containing protein [Pseudomonas cichorii]MBX8541242.1 PAAR domain-containing protein [Pseudomonas cichorii]MBX8546506.1 PAAR domain-containing protein [Pseudomonas cichorii]MBX8561268.1 PAAR domain-containing protein [Pseudomonas cichorii]MBX8581007.1 PAAR domain-containing protein [Pseudomonas cichorii]MBX8599391.1 PAAR domain-containing protein [Pseudomonas cichorii]
MTPTARLGDMHLCPIPGHGKSPIVSASPDTNINFMGAARVGDICGCGAVITTGFASIIVDHRPLAYLGSPTSHGGTIISGSSDTFGGFQFGGTGIQAIIDFAKLGAVRPDGSVDDQLMSELLADPQLQQRALLSGALVQPGSSPSAATTEPLTPELIAVAGSQHDTGSGNKMMFIGQAVGELAEFKRSKSDLTRTLVVFTPSYSTEMLSAARNSAKAYGAGYVSVANAKELIEYLNRGKDRNQSPIEHLSLFSHGVPQRIAFGYQLVEDPQMSLDVLNYKDVSVLAFSSAAQIDSYACRTGMGNRSEYQIEDGIQFFPQTNESLAQLLADHLQIKVRAFIRRSDYKNTWGSFEERQLGKLCGISTGTSESPWCKKWNTLKDERSMHHRKFKFTYQTMGAINPVISGDTPIGVPGGYFEFLPK